LSSPHTSAGRIPTAQGYRLFVDSLLQTSPIDASALQALKHELNPNRTSSDLIASASNLLTQVTAQAGIVTVPRPTASQLRQIEFLPLSDSRVLVILVVNEREVQNRVIELSRPLSEEQLKVAADLINQRYAGNNLSEVKRMLVAEMADARARIDEQLEAALQIAKDAMEPEDAQEEYVVAGESRLVQQAGANDMNKLRELFDAFERKRDLVELLDRCSRADGIQIFIGEEAGYEVLGDYSVITAPYAQGTQPVGVLGVIGPTRMAYDRVIPLVDITARLLTAALSR
jgi:heat-inducible transcriptional repressor